MAEGYSNAKIYEVAHAIDSGDIAFISEVRQLKRVFYGEMELIQWQNNTDIARKNLKQWQAI